MESIDFYHNNLPITIRFYYTLNPFDLKDVYIENNKLNLFIEKNYMSDDNKFIYKICNYLFALADHVINKDPLDKKSANIFLKYSSIIRNDYKQWFNRIN